LLILQSQQAKNADLFEKLKVTKCDLAILSGENSNYESFCKTD